MNRNTVVVLIGGGAVITANWINKVKSVLVAWYPGCEGGTAIAETLFGYANPGGKLPLGFPCCDGQLPYFYNSKPTGRRYDYNDLRGKQHEFAFGHGLSYTRFKYSRMRIERINGLGLKIRCSIRNTGRRSGDEVVQLYIHDVYSSLTRPLKELKGFKRIHLVAGKSRVVEFKLTRKDFSLSWRKAQVRVRARRIRDHDRFVIGRYTADSNRGSLSINLRRRLLKTKIPIAKQIGAALPDCQGVPAGIPAPGKGFLISTSR